MADFSLALGKVVQEAREKCGYTQAYVGEQIGKTDKSISNIETGKANPRMDALYAIVRLLRIDPNQIFYPEMLTNTPARQQLQYLLAGCSESEIQALLPICSAIIESWKNKKLIGTVEE